MQHKPVSAIDLHICWRCLPRLTLFWRALNKMERDVSASNLHFIFETVSSPIFLCWVFCFSAGNAMFDPSLLTRFGQFQVNFEFQVNFATGVLSCFPSLSLSLSLSLSPSLSLSMAVCVQAALGCFSCWRNWRLQWAWIFNWPTCAQAHQNQESWWLQQTMRKPKQPKTIRELPKLSGTHLTLDTFRRSVVCP